MTCDTQVTVSVVGVSAHKGEQRGSDQLIIQVQHAESAPDSVQHNEIGLTCRHAHLQGASEKVCAAVIVAFELRHDAVGTGVNGHQCVKGTAIGVEVKHTRFSGDKGD